MQNIKMLLFFHVKTPRFEVFLSCEFIWLAFLCFPPPLTLLLFQAFYLCDCVYVYTHICENRTAFTAVRFHTIFPTRADCRNQLEVEIHIYTPLLNGDECKWSGKSVELPEHHSWKFQVLFLLPDSDTMMFPSLVLVSIQQFLNFPEYNWHFNMKTFFGQ